jgi:hypothetical protein
MKRTSTDQPVQHTRTVAYSLRVPGPAAATADRLRDDARTLGANVIGSHVDGPAGVLRFRAKNDEAAVALAVALVGQESTGVTLEAGFGTMRRSVATS